MLSSLPEGCRAGFEHLLEMTKGGASLPESNGGDLVKVLTPPW